MFDLHAIRFEGMPLALFLGVWVAVVLLTGALFFGYRHWRGSGLAQRPFWWTLLCLAVIVGGIGSAVWRTWFCPPLPLPANAQAIEIHSQRWWSEQPLERMKFKLNEADFIRWIEAVTHYSWPELDRIPVQVRFLAFQDGLSLSQAPAADSITALVAQFDPAGPWNTAGVRSGYFIKPKTVRVFPGQILYDKETELLYYVRP